MGPELPAPAEHFVDEAQAALTATVRIPTPTFGWGFSVQFESTCGSTLRTSAKRRQVARCRTCTTTSQGLRPWRVVTPCSRSRFLVPDADVGVGPAKKQMVFAIFMALEPIEQLLEAW